jgi:phosphate acyltransferase
MTVTLAVDLMGGDVSPLLLMGAAVSFLRAHPDCRIDLHGTAACFQPDLIKNLTPELAARVQRVESPAAVTSTDKPVWALRHRRDSTLWAALTALADGRVQAVLSPGNTGALMAMASHLLGLMPGLSRPALCKSMPLCPSACYVLDLGANVQADARQLVQFALMGIALLTAEGVMRPRVGLLNLGVESGKGDSIRQQADTQLRKLADVPFEYCGFVEGSAFFDGSVNLVVCDGFSGNVALKASEALALALKRDAHTYFSTNLWTRLQGGLAYAVLRPWLRRLNPAAYNGALLLGLNRVVVKSHGAAGVEGFGAALQVAYEQAQRQPQAGLASWLSQANPVSPDERDPVN